MKPFIANLKVYFQIPLLYFFYLGMAGLFVTIVCLVPDAEIAWMGHFFCVLIWSALSAAGVQREVLARPVTFCLPKTRNYTKWILLGWGIVVSSLSLILFMVKSDLTQFEGLISRIELYLAIWLLVLTAFLMQVMAFLKSGFNRVQTLVFFAVSLGAFFLLEASLTGYPLWGVLGGGLGVFFCCRQLDDESLARRICLGGSHMIFLGVNAPDMNKRHSAKVSEKTVLFSDWWFALLLPVMKRAGQGKVVRNGTGYLFYLIQETLLGRPVLLIAILVVFLCADGYLFGSIEDSLARSLSNIFYFSPALFVGANGLRFFPPRPELLVPAGRKERFFGTLYAITLCLIFWSGLIGVMVLLANWVTPVMPAFSTNSLVGTISFVPPRLALLGLVPLLLAGSFLLHALLGTGWLIYFLNIYWVIIIGSLGLYTFESLSAMTLVSITVGLWAMVALALWYRCFRCDLGGPGRGIAARLKNRFGTRRSDRALPANRF